MAVREVSYLNPRLVDRVGEAARVVPGELLVSDGDCFENADVRSVLPGQPVALFLSWNGGPGEQVDLPEGERTPWRVFAVAEILEGGNLHWLGWGGMYLDSSDLEPQQSGTPFEALLKWIAQARQGSDT